MENQNKIDEEIRAHMDRGAMAAFSGFGEILEEKRHHETLEIQNNHHKEILKTQNEFNGKSLEQQRKSNRLTGYIVIATIIALVISSIFSVLQNNREENDFELRMRPYLTIEEIRYQPINNRNRTMEYIFVIKNSGTLPAKLLEVNSSINCPNKKEQSEIINKKNARSSGSLISPQGTMDFKYEVEWLSSKNITNPLDRPELTFTLNYKAALEEFQDKEYTTWESYWMKFNERPEIIEGYMA